MKQIKTIIMVSALFVGVPAMASDFGAYSPTLWQRVMSYVRPAARATWNLAGGVTTQAGMLARYMTTGSVNALYSVKDWWSPRAITFSRCTSPYPQVDRELPVPSSDEPASASTVQNESSTSSSTYPILDNYTLNVGGIGIKPGTDGDLEIDRYHGVRIAIHQTVVHYAQLYEVCNVSDYETLAGRVSNRFVELVKAGHVQDAPRCLAQLIAQEAQQLPARTSMYPRVDYAAWLVSARQECDAMQLRAELRKQLDDLDAQCASLALVIGDPTETSEEQKRVAQQMLAQAQQEREAAHAVLLQLDS